MLYEAATGKRPVADLNVQELTNLGLVINERINHLKERIERLGGAALMAPPPSTQPTEASSSLPPLVPYANGAGMEGNKRMKVSTHQKGWFINMSTMTGDAGTSADVEGNTGVGTSARGDMMHLSN
jgi:hypothetical protein